MSTVVIEESVCIKRPIDEVRSQFCDMKYHAQQNVHPDLTLDVHSVDGNVCRFRQDIRLMGIPQSDEIVNTLLDNGDLLSEVVGGSNVGLTIRFAFVAQAPSETRVNATLIAPMNGLRSLIAPLFRFGARMTARRAFEQDRKDLEGGRYASTVHS